MPFNVLLLPLLGGYVFVTQWNQTRFSTRRYSGERLIFHAAIAGVLFLAAAFLIILGVLSLWPSLDAEWHRFVPFPYSGTSALAFALGATLWWPANKLLFDREAAVRRVVEEWNDYLEILLNEAFHKVDMVSISTRSRKVYVGFVTRPFDPVHERKYVTLIPAISGYRSEGDLQLSFTTDYVWVYQQLIRLDPARIRRTGEDFQIIVPVSEIVSANPFNPTAYDLFNNLPADEEGQPAAADSSVA